jgi:hypothetical protein
MRYFLEAYNENLSNFLIFLINLSLSSIDNDCQ